MTHDSGGGGTNGASSAARCGAHEASGATLIKLKISNFSGGIAPQHPVNDKFKPSMSLPSCTVVYTQTNMEEKLIVAVCGHRPELTDPRAGLQSA